jgi:ceramide glucosyltransferase
MIETLLTLAALIALAYQLAACAAVHRHLSRAVFPSAYAPPVSILKPVCGLDEDFEAAIRSHAAQDYQHFEIVFGAHSAADPAVPAIRKLIEEFPHVPIRLIISENRAVNGKVGTLIELVREARHGILLVNDSDVTVPAYYLSKVVQPLRFDGTGLVTCLYRPAASSFPGRWEAFSIATGFIPRSASEKATSTPSADSKPSQTSLPTTISSPRESLRWASAPT